MTTTLTEFEPAPLDKEIALDPAWLTEAFRRGGHDVKVRSAELLEAIGWNCLSLRTRLTFDGPQGEIPDQICIKGLFGERREIYLREDGPLVAESTYYTDVAPKLGLNSPRCFYAGIDKRTGSGVQVLEDLIPLGCRFYSALDNFNEDQVRQSLSQLARLHGGTWNVSPDFLPNVRSFSVLSTIAEKGAQAEGGAAELTGQMADRRGNALPDDHRSGERLYAALAKLYTLYKDGPLNFMHGDDHAGNFYDIAGRVGIFDWQILQRGHWALDIGYHIPSVLTIEDRRAWEQDLLRFYFDQVTEHGGTPPDWETGWNLYRQSIPYGHYLWAITKKVEIEIIESNVTRTGTAMVDHGSYARLGV